MLLLLGALAISPLLAALALIAWAALLGDSHATVWRLTVYGRATAMHGALLFRTERWGYLCLRLPTWKWGRLVAWKAYASRDATPAGARWGIGPGLAPHDRERIARRRRTLRILHGGIDAMGDDDLDRVADRLERDEPVVLSYPSSTAVAAYEAERELYAGGI